MSAFHPLRALGGSEMLRIMRWSILVPVTVVLSGCANTQSDARQIADAQAKSFYGQTAKWELDSALPQSTIQAMRDRAYRYCFDEKASAEGCLDEQDHSLFQYANSFRLVRTFRSEAEPTFPFAAAHKQDPAAFERVHLYCRSIYQDQGARDARALGPCMSAGVGADFFSVIPVP